MKLTSHPSLTIAKMKKPEPDDPVKSPASSLLQSFDQSAGLGSNLLDTDNQTMLDLGNLTDKRSKQAEENTLFDNRNAEESQTPQIDRLTELLQLGESHALAALKNEEVEAKPNHIAICMRVRFFNFIKEVYTPLKSQPEAVKELIEIASDYASDADLRMILHWDFPYRNPIKALLSSNRIQLLQDLIATRELCANSCEFRSLLKNKQIAAAKKSISSCKKSCPYKTNKLLKKCKNIRALIRLIKDPELVLEAVMLLRTVQSQYISVLHLLELKRLLKEVIKPKPGGMLALHGNPILVCVVLAELCDSCKQNSGEYAWEFEELSTNFCTLAGLILNDTKDFLRVEAILLDDSYRRIPLFDLLTRNSKRYRALLQHPYLVIIIDRLWSGGSELKFGLQHCSFVYSKTMRSSPEKLWQVKPLTPKDMSIFQFRAWKYNATVRQVLEGLLLFLLFVHSLYIASIYTTSTLVEESPLGHTVTESNDANDNLVTVQDAIDMYLVLMLLLAINLGCKFIYKFLLKESIFPDPRVITDLVLTACAFCFKLQVFGSVTKYKSNYEYLWAVLFSVMLIRASLCLTITRQFGPILKMIQIIIFDISRYLFVYFISICVFAVAANLLFFRDGEPYETFSRSMITMFESSLGNFNFETFSYRKYTGWAFLTIWIFFSAVILLNLLIAVLSSRYEELSPQANADYVSLMFTYYSSSRFTPVYGALVLFPVPWNAVMVPFIPFFFFKRTAYKATFYLSHLSYVVLLAFTVLIFSLYNLMLIPVAYIKNIRWLASESPFPGKSTTIAVWVFLGPAYLFMMGIFSYKVLFKFLYDEGSGNEVNQKPVDAIEPLPSKAEED